MTNPVSIRNLAVSSAAHPWRTIAAWSTAAVPAIVAVGALLGGSLSSDNHPTDERESQRAADLIERSFPAGSGAATTDVVVIRSERNTVGAPEFRRLVSGLADELRAERGVADPKTYVDTRNARWMPRLQIEGARPTASLS